jgi:hypothetical protein
MVTLFYRNGKTEGMPPNSLRALDYLRMKAPLSEDWNRFGKKFVANWAKIRHADAISFQ